MKPCNYETCGGTLGDKFLEMEMLSIRQICLEISSTHAILLKIQLLNQKILLESN